MRHRRRSDAFTLVELMIVVAIIGVLAALALYSVSGYLKHAKTAEASRSIAAIEGGERTQFALEVPFGMGVDGLYVHRFCPKTPPLTPPAVPVGSKTKVPATLWDHEGWRCLKFSINEPMFYSYRADTNGDDGTRATYTVDAFGDLDGNGVLSTFHVEGVGGSTGELRRDILLILNEDE